MRHALRAAIRPALTILLVVCALSCGPKSVETEFSPWLVDAQGRPSLGYLEHRGEMYDLRDWSSSVYDDGEGNNGLAGMILFPTMADSGGGFYSVTFISQPVLGDMEARMFGFGLEDLEEEQCVEITDLDGPIPPNLRLLFPEQP